MINFLKEKYPDFAYKINLLSHYYNINNMPMLHHEFENKNKLIIYGGTIYEGVINWYNRFANSIVKEYAGLQIHLYTNSELDENFNNNFKIFNELNESDYFKKLYQADYYLACYPYVYKDFISS